MLTWLWRINPANDPPPAQTHSPEAHAVAAQQLQIGADLAQLHRQAWLDTQARLFRREEGDDVAHS